MVKHILSLLFIALGTFSYMNAQDYLISTSNTSLLLTAKQGETARIHYYGTRIEKEQIQQIYNAGLAFHSETYPVFGIHSYNDKAMQVTHGDGNMSLDLVVESVKQYAVPEAEITEILLKDKVYPFFIKQHYKAYKNSDVIGTWIEVINQEKKPVTMYKFASAFVPLRRGDNWLTHLHGTWGAENMLQEEKLTDGQKVIKNEDGVRNTMSENPSFMLTLDGKPQEETGHVFGASLAWSGNYTLKLDVDNNKTIKIYAGINEDASYYTLEPKKSFITPEFAMTYSTSGKGGVSRNFHRWARMYKLSHADVNRDILLNSWEGVYFKVNQEVMDQMMKDMSQLGGELFVMDDGWFGDKYPRDDDKTSLGDWMVCRKKLPQGIEGLVASAKKQGIKFGIWIEPEMVNSKSELYEKHPDWIVCQNNRTPSTGRGGTQMILDLSNPEVQNFVFGVVDNLLTDHPEIAYIKWDANASMMNYGSYYLPKDRQSHLYIEYHKGLNNVLERIQAKYPNLLMQACASGGSRVNYGLLPYFGEFWTSDNTDAYQRIYMQWGVSSFYPAIAMASHVSADRNHQTGRRTPLKFRFDVAMSGRLGMEMQPKDMTEEDKEFAKRAIKAYKEIRPMVQHGDLYRLVSPYDKVGFASLMYATPEKDKAVFFAYRMEYLLNQVTPRVRMTGVDAQKLYKLVEMTPLKESKKNSLDGKVISGKLLMEEGIEVPFSGDYSSVVMQLIEVR